MKAGPMKIFAHLPACLRYWHFSHSLRPCRCDAYQEIQAIWAKLDEHSDGLDALDRGIVEAGQMALDAERKAAKAGAQVEAMLGWIRDRAAEAGLRETARELPLSPRETGALLGLEKELAADDVLAAVCEMFGSLPGGAS
jgi:hypothetical protein